MVRVKYENEYAFVLLSQVGFVLGRNKQGDIHHRDLK